MVNFYLYSRNHDSLHGLFLYAKCYTMRNASKPDDFNLMSLSDKYSYISEYGKYIGVRSYYGYLINLHLVGDTFFEVWYFEPDNAIERIEQLDDMKKIDLYIKYMLELDELQKNPGIIE